MSFTPVVVNTIVHTYLQIANTLFLCYNYTMEKTAADYFDEFYALANKEGRGNISAEQEGLFCKANYMLMVEGDDYYSKPHAELGKQLMRPNQ
jgi:hypothetical protein